MFAFRQLVPTKSYWLLTGGTLIIEHLLVCICMYHTECKLFWISSLHKCCHINILEFKYFLMLHNPPKLFFFRVQYRQALARTLHPAPLFYHHPHCSGHKIWHWFDFVSLVKLLTSFPAPPHCQGDVINLYSKIHNIFSPLFLGFYMGI